MNTTQILAHLTTCLPRLALQLRAEARLAELALDSLDTVELLCVIHAEFGVRLTEAEFHPEQTIGRLVEVIARNRAVVSPAAPGISPAKNFTSGTLVEAGETPALLLL